MKKNAFKATITILLLMVVSVSYSQNKKNKMENKIQVIGNKFKVVFGQMKFQLHFESATQLTFTVLEIQPADLVGYSETVQTTMVEVRPNMYMVYWKEKSGTTVTHLEDFQNEIVYTNITNPDHTFVNLKGTLTPMK